MRSLRSALAVVVMACCLAAMAHAGGATGSIVGTISDQTGAVLVGEVVALRNQANGTVRSTLTNQVGEYAFVLLPPGLYSITVHVTGFREATHADIKLDVDQTVRANLTLEMAAATEALTVSGDIPLIATDSSSMGQVVDRNLVSQLPLNERNYLNFALLVPGAQIPVAGSVASTIGGGSVSVNGAREQSNTFLLDGVDNNNLLINRTTVLPSVDAIEEFKVQSSTYSAEYGRSGGAQINLVLKSGTNQLHGGAFEFFRNRLMDAKNYFDLPDCHAGSVPGTCGPIPRYQRSQYGGTVGGPIRRDKSFYFVSYEGLTLRQATTRESTVPSQKEKTAVLAAVPPSLQNQAGVNALNLYPAANVGADLVNSTLYVAAPVIESGVNQGTVKFDFQLSPHDMLSAHYAIYDNNRYNPYDVGFTVTNLPGYGDYDVNRGQNIGVNWVHSFGPQATNELRFGFNRDRLAIFQQSIGINRSAQLGFPAPTNPLDWGYPIITVTGYETIGEPYLAPEDNTVNTFQIADNLDWLPQFQGGRHHFRFGGDFRSIQNTGYSDFYSRGDWIFLGVTGNSLEDLVLGLPAANLFARGTTYVNLHTYGLSLFVLDDIRVNSRFTLNLGLRYEYNSAPVDADNHLSVPDLSPNSATCSPMPDCQFIVAGTFGVPRATYTTGKLNFAPRIGFAWLPFASGRMVVRSGYGIFYDATILDVSTLLADNPPFYDYRYNINDGTENIQTIVDSPVSKIISFRVSPDYHDAYMQQWNLGVQYQLTTNLALEMAYVGSKGTHLLGFSDNNQAQPTGGLPPFVPPYPQFGSIATMDSERASNYNALQVRAEQRPWHGASFLLAYTWSKSIDNGSEFIGSSTEGQFAQDYYDLGGERGLSAFDVRHRFVVSFVWRLPFGPGARFLDHNDAVGKIVKDWQVSSIIAAQTGQPFTINRSIYQSYSTLILGTDRPDLIANPMQAGPVMANPNPACHTTISHGGLAADQTGTVQSWINPCAYSNPNLLGQFNFGSAPRNEVISPGLTEVDLSVSRLFSLGGERFHLLARADIFNLFNHPNFDPPDRTFDSRNFGALISANAYGNRPPRQIQLGLRLVF